MPIIGEMAAPHRQPEENSRHGRLTARLAPPVSASDRTGSVSFDGPAGERLALAHIPEPADGRPYRLALLLHGAGGSPRQALDLMRPVADEQRLLVMAPQSTATTWDLIGFGFGPDVRRIDHLLQEVLAAYPVSGMLIGGFSDGASYALSLGLINGDVFDSVLAFSPGFAAPLVTHGKPRVFVSHGTADRVLPVDRCSRRLVPRLRAMGYEITYEEFDGGHEVPQAIVRRAVAWLNSTA
jgi:phospholipase/carboxylesterase